MRKVKIFNGDGKSRDERESLHTDFAQNRKEGGRY